MFIFFMTTIKGNFHKYQTVNALPGFQSKGKSYFNTTLSFFARIVFKRVVQS